MNSRDYNLKNDREQIDILDRKILELLNERAKLSINIARIKSQSKLPVLSPERENKLLEKIIAQNSGPFDNKSIHNIFNSIMDESKRLQNFVLKKTDSNKINDK